MIIKKKKIFAAMAMPVWALPRWLQGFKPIAVGAVKKNKKCCPLKNQTGSLVWFQK